MHSPPAYLVFKLLVLCGGVGLHLRRTAGRLAPRLALTPLRFFARRRAILIGTLALTIALGCLWHRLVPARPWTPLGELTRDGLCLVCSFGFVMLAWSIPFLIARRLAPPPVLPLAPGETLLHERAGGHLCDDELRAGTILVTTRRLGFVPNRYPLSTTPWSVPLEDLRAVDREGSQFVVVEALNAAPEYLRCSDAATLPEQVRQAHRQLLARQARFWAAL